MESDYLLVSPVYRPILLLVIWSLEFGHRVLHDFSQHGRERGAFLQNAAEECGENQATFSPIV